MPNTLPMACVLALGDSQSPFHHKDTLQFWKRLKKKWKPDVVVHMGDNLDLKYLKYWSVNDEDTAWEQHKKSVDFHSDMFSLFPDLVILESNHNDRHYAVAEKYGIPSFHLKTMHELVSAPKTVKIVSKFEVEDVAYIHGHTLKGSGLDGLAKNAIMKYQQSVVIGHCATLLGSVQYNTWKNNFFFMATGCMADIHSYGMKFLRDMNMPIALGAGVVVDGKHPYPERFVE